MAEFDAPPLLDGLTRQPWQPMQCDKIEYKDDDDFELDELLDGIDSNANDSSKVFQIKCQFNQSSLAILLTDLINVWYCEQSESDVRATQSENNPSMVVNGPMTNITRHIQDMLCFSQHKGSRHSKTISFDNDSKRECVLSTSMLVEGLIEFKWRFQFKQYGASLDQATLLKQQFIIPLMAMVNQMASKANVDPTAVDDGQRITDTFLKFNIRETMGDLYGKTMDWTLTQMASLGDDQTMKPSMAPNAESNNQNEMVSNVRISSLPQSTRLKMPKGKRKRPLMEMSDSDGGNGEKKKKRRVSEGSDDDVLNGLVGREDDLKMSAFDHRSEVKERNGDGVIGTLTFNVAANESEREEMKRREELKQRMLAKKNKKKKKKKLKI